MDYSNIIHTICDPFLHNPDSLIVREAPTSDEKSVTLLIYAEAEDTANDNTPKANNATSTITDISQIACPLCKTGHLLKGHTAYGCSNFRNGCSLRLIFDQYPADIAPDELRKLISQSFNNNE